MATITQDILNQVFREYLKTLPAPDDMDKDVRSASLIPRFEQQVNQLASEFKGSVAAPAPARSSRSFYTRRQPRSNTMFGFRRTARRQRAWWLPRSRDLNPPASV